MKKGISVLLAALFLLWAAAEVPAWQIESFDVDLAVQPDGALLVEETILADFQGEPRHGIYRDIPLQTGDPYGIRRSIFLKFLGATDEGDKGWESRLTQEGVYRRIRLGSEGVTHRGKKTFRIRYKAERTLGFFPEHDELYWNATGNGWTIPILQARATVRLPGNIHSGQLRPAAYVGVHGSRSGDVTIHLLGSDAVQYTTSRPLNPFEGFTVVAGWPKGVVNPPSPGKRGWWLFVDNVYLLFPLLTLALMGTLWRRFGRDPKPGAIVVQYDPPDSLSPAEVGTLVDDRVDVKDITASIVDLARRGYLGIEEKGL